MTPKLQDTINSVKHDAMEQQSKWWDYIADDECFETWTDYDQENLDGIFSRYNQIISQLINDNNVLEAKLKS